MGFRKLVRQFAFAFSLFDFVQTACTFPAAVAQALIVENGLELPARRGGPTGRPIRNTSISSEMGPIGSSVSAFPTAKKRIFCEYPSA